MFENIVFRFPEAIFIFYNTMWYLYSIFTCIVKTAFAVKINISLKAYRPADLILIIVSEFGGGNALKFFECAYERNGIIIPHGFGNFVY